MSEITREAEVCDHCGTDERTLGQLTRRAEAAERERDRLRGALERVESLTCDANDAIVCQHFGDASECVIEARDIARAALAGEGKAPTCAWEQDATPEKAREA